MNLHCVGIVFYVHNPVSFKEQVLEIELKVCIRSVWVHVPTLLPEADGPVPAGDPSSRPQSREPAVGGGTLRERERREKEIGTCQLNPTIHRRVVLKSLSVPCQEI